MNKKHLIKNRIAGITLAIVVILTGLPVAIYTNPITVHAAELVAKQTLKPTNYNPTQIVNGDFSAVPGMRFRYSNKDYGTSYYTSLGQVIVSSITPNGVGQGWNTTEQKLYKGSLFEYVVTSTLGQFCKWSEYSNKFTTPYGNCVEMNSYVSGTLYQDLATVGGDVIMWTLDHTARTPGGDATQKMLVEIGSPNYSSSGSILYPTYKDGGVTVSNNIEASSAAIYKNTGVTNGSKNCGSAKTSELAKLSVTQNESNKWYTCKGIYVVPEGQTVTRFAFQSLSNTPTAGNMLDNITFSTLIGNLAAKSFTNGNVKITGYWGETDKTKQLKIELDGRTYSVNMNDVTGGYFEIEIPASTVGIAEVASVYHQDYQAAAKEVEILRYTNYGTDGLNNLSIKDDEKESVSTAKRVVGMYDASDSDNPVTKDSYSNLSVNLNSKDDSVKVYNLADVTYTEREVEGITIGSYNVKWNDTVSKWLEEQRKIGKYTSSIYDDPMSFGASTSESQRAKFYKDLLSNAGNVLTGDGALNEVTAGTENSTEEPPTYVRQKLPFGIYAVMAQDEDHVPYAPLVVSMIPYQNGPTGNYYVKYDYVASLKDASATVDKYINGKDADTVEIGETVRFDIEVTIPLTKAKVTLDETGAEIDHYKMQLVDTMNKAFMIKDTNNDGVINASDISIKYLTAAEGTAVPLEAAIVDYYVIAKPGYTGTSVTLDFTDTQKEYTYDNKEVKELEGCKAISQSGAIYTVNEVKSAYGEDGSIKINFNIPALKAWLKKDDTPNTLYKVLISYEAIVTDKVQVNSDGNINRFTLETDADDPISSEASAYTYAMRLEKVDGSTVGTDDVKRLPGAAFEIYKETDVFLKDGEGHYTWLGDTAGSNETKLSVTKDGDTITALPSSPDFYIYEEVLKFTEEAPTETPGTPSDPTPDAGDGGEEENNDEQGDAGADTPSDETEPEAAAELLNVNITTVALKKNSESGKLEPVEINSTANPEYDGYTLVHVYQLYKAEVKTMDERSNTTTLYSFDGSFVTKDADSGDEAGTYTISGLKEGNYIVQETKAPAGYNDLAEDILFSIKKLDDDTALIETYKAFRQMDDTINRTGVIDLTVLNFKGLTLPSTGGVGTSAFVFFGLGLMAIAMLILILRRKNN